MGSSLEASAAPSAPSARRAAIVVDLGFGDAGKGLVTDYLTGAMGATLVVRFNGGAQAGHNVVTSDGRHHTFAQLGAGSFRPGVRTHLARTAVVHPTALAVEAAHLARAGVPGALSSVSVSARALVVTPFHQAANRLREMARGADRHGSCGAGVGETVADAVASPDEAIRIGDLCLGPAGDRAGLVRSLTRLAARKRDELVEVLPAARAASDGASSDVDAEIRMLEDPEVVGRWIDAARAAMADVSVVDDAWLARELRAAPAAVFEGAQGVLLDEWAGFHPHTTYSTCTFANALELLRDAEYDGEVTRVGVLRTYLVRHGHGPFPTVDADLAARLPEPHNEEGPWQGRVRRGWPDALLARYAARVSGGVDALALTHLDALARLPSWKACRSYRVAEDDGSLFESDAAVPRAPRRATGIVPPTSHDLDRQARLTAALARAVPEYEGVDWSGTDGRARAIELFERAVGAKVSWTSSGPRCEDVSNR